MKLGVVAAAGAALLLLAAAAQPRALAGVQPGLWELAGAPGAAQPVRRCIADVAALAQHEHDRRTCTRVVISEDGDSTVIHYTCAGGGFGRATMTVLTPRSLRIEVQGISSDLPFNYILQARRVGNCQGH
ncbi:MAG TPA: DUF3617 family protein [Sphingomicrobium sp.]|nr:DUF3617 family protein [Sphingomicrobium sp.]